MRTNGEMQRQAMGCGWLPPAPERLRPFVSIPDPLSFKPTLDENGERVVSVCPGYLVRLPQVVEIAGARHWKGGNLRDYCDGKPSEHLMQGVVILDYAVNEHQLWCATPKDQGGGGG